MGLLEFGAAVYKILGVVLTLLGIANAIDAKPVAQEDSPKKIQTATLAIANYIIDPVFGIPRVLSNQAALLAALGSVQTTLLAAIGSPQQTGVAVTLPTTPPTGYGAATTSAIGDAVWQYATGFPSGNALGALSEIRYGVVQRDVASAGYPLGNFPGWWIEGPFWNSIHTPNPGHNVFALDFSTILPTDATPDAWVEREYSAANWFTPFNGYPILLGDDSFRYFLPWLTQPEFDRFKAAMVPPVLPLPPVWPGLAHVTLGTPVALSSSFSIAVPCDGVIVDIASVPSRFGRFNFGSQFKYLNQGSLAFVSDNGDAEEPQALGFTSAVFVPRTMIRAASVGVRSPNGATGTVTPWTTT